MASLLDKLELPEDLSKYTEIVLAVCVVGILMVLLFPIPTILLDCLLAFSIATACIILMTTLFIIRPLELSIFPTLLLITTLLRLSLNIASTRLILSNGHNGSSAAGNIIEAFGGFVMQGNVVIGLIVFLILTLINFIVITKGSGRIAEVAARFSLDALPGKQMAIDADLAAGLIDEKTAKIRRKDLEDESTFYGAMDGANKFVRGDAIAGLIITFINLVGGMIVGILQKNLSFDVAVQTYTILTIGDGLVSQIPSLIISMSAGLLVTKASTAASTDKMILQQLSRYPQALVMTSVVTIMMAFLPGLPFLPFAIVGIASALSGYYLHFSIQQTPEYQAVQGSSAGAPSNWQAPTTIDAGSGAPDAAHGGEENIGQSLQLDLIKLEIGFGLMGLINESDGHNLTEQIKSLRKSMAEEYGFVIPSVRIQDNIQLDNNHYVIKIKELEAGRGMVRPSKLMVMDPASGYIGVDGEDVKEPTFGLDAKWIDSSKKDEALFNNYTVVDPSTVITTHLTELVKENITDLLSYGQTQKLLDELELEHQKLVKDVVPDVVSVSTLQKVLQGLLSESVSIRDLPTILESVADSLRNNKNLNGINEAVRVRLARQICLSNLANDGVLHIVSMSNIWEETFIQNLVDDGSGEKQLSLPPTKLQEFVQLIRDTFNKHADMSPLPVLVCSSYNRTYVRSIVERFKPEVTVLSQNEIFHKVKIKTLESI